LDGESRAGVSGRELHVILDNSSSHRTPAVRAWLAAHPWCTSTTLRPARPGSLKWRVLRHPRQTVAERDLLPFDAGPARPPPRLHARLEEEPDAVRLDETRRGDHPLPPPNA